jgi:predicted NBD/HSP70 family sugar kinase
MRTKFKLGLFDIFGEIITEREINHECANDPACVMDRMKREISAIMAENSDKHVLGVGIAVPGPYFWQEGRIATISDFEGWEDVKFKEEMTKGFGLPMIIDHDANAGALAELLVAPNELTQGTFVYLSVDEGVGAGIVNDGKLFRGAIGTAGEVGHMSVDVNGDVCECGNRGCLAHCASVNYLMQSAKREAARHPGTTLREGFSFDDLVRSIKEGDPAALMAFGETAKNLSAGIINIMCAYGANEIIIGERVSRIGDFLLDTLREFIRARTFKDFFDKVRIRLTSLKGDPIFIGAAALAIDYCLRRTQVFKN